MLPQQMQQGDAACIWILIRHRFDTVRHVRFCFCLTPQAEQSDKPDKRQRAKPAHSNRKGQIGKHPACRVFRQADVLQAAQKRRF
jgi:hypothetical protein